MIRVSVLYPRTSGKRFDLEYYQRHHMTLVKERLTPLKVEIDIGIPNNQNQPPHHIAIGHMTFETMEKLVVKYDAAAQELHADIPNYTDIEPIIQLSEIIEI
jgi:uncharacterized protein (TIGR02118 family)